MKKDREGKRSKMMIGEKSSKLVLTFFIKSMMTEKEKFVSTCPINNKTKDKKSWIKLRSKNV